jgi:hypothetical protein
MSDDWCKVFKQQEHERNVLECEAYDRLLEDRRALLGQLGIAARAWRRAEIHVSALQLGVRSGQLDLAENVVENRLAALRIATDKYNRS